MEYVGIMETRVCKKIGVGVQTCHFTLVNIFRCINDSHWDLYLWLPVKMLYCVEVFQEDIRMFHSHTEFF